jgi:hypothetical protein
MFATYSSNMNMSSDAAYAPDGQSACLAESMDAALMRVVSFLLKPAREHLLRWGMPARQNR